MTFLAVQTVLLGCLVAAFPLSAQSLQMNTVYQCRVPISLKVLSCTGGNPNDTCQVQVYNAGRALPVGRSTYAQVMTLLAQCHVQTAAEAQAEKSSAVAPLQLGGGAGPGGFKVGDTVRVLFNGWQEAKVLQVRGRSYFVRLPNGVEVSKEWPVEVRRMGKLTAEDHAAGQYDAHERVQVLINGRWAEGEVTGQQYNMYTVKVPGYRGEFDSDTVSTTPENIRISTTPAPPPPAQRAAGQAPKPGYTSCAGKYEGRWESTTGMGGMRVVFRSGKATITEGFSNLGEFDCFLGDGKVYFYKAGSFKPYDDVYEINNDGTLQTGLGAIKKMGN